MCCSSGSTVRRQREPGGIRGRTGSARQVPVTLTVVAAANQTLTFTYQAGAANPAPQNVPLTSTGGAVSLSAEAFSDENWLAVSPSSGTTPVTFSCSVNPAGLAPRTYSGLMFVTDTTTATVFVVGIRVPFRKRRVTPNTNFEGIIREYKQN